MIFLIIDELSMLSIDLWTNIDSRMGEIFSMIPEKAFAGLSVVTVADLLQLPPVRGKLIFSYFFDKNSIKNLLGLQLWHLFKYAELTEVVRQKDKLFIDLFDEVRVGNIDMMSKSYSRQNLYINLIKTIQKMLCTFMQRKDLP